MNLVKFQPEHVKTLALQENQLMVAPLLDNPNYARSVMEAGPCWTAVQGERVLGAGGVCIQWEGRAIAWTLLDKRCGPHMLAIHREAQGFLNLCHVKGIRRIEAYVDPNHRAAIRWITMLGFRCECRMPVFTPDGRDSLLYARIR